jgi:hypothetical protein
MRHLLVIADLAVSTVAAADPPKPAAQMATDDCARARKAGKTCVLSIEGEELNGDRPPPSDINVGILKFNNLGSLIRVRRDFIPEIIKSAEDL